MFFYGLTDDITIGASLPYVLNASISAPDFDEESMLGRINHLGNSYGISDANLFSMWRLLNEDKYPFSLALLSGINAPTGKTTVRDNQGALFSAADQPGSGAWTPFAGLIVSKEFGKFGLSSNIVYTQGVEGKQNTTLGSIFDYNFATVYKLYDNQVSEINIYGIMELNGEYVAKDNIDGIVDQNSGGTNLFLLPGFRVNWRNFISCYLGVNIPLSQNYNGAQANSAYGITSGIDIDI
jgi:hypothetical protein